MTKASLIKFHTAKLATLNANLKQGTSSREVYATWLAKRAAVTKVLNSLKAA